MGSVTLAGTFEYIENDGTVVTEDIDIDDTFESAIKLDISEAGVAVYPVPFGTVVTAKAVLIRMLHGDTKVLFEGVADGPTILEGGCKAFILSNCTSIDLDHAVDIEAEVTILGDLA